MQPTYTADANAFREKIQAFLAEHLPNDWTGLGALDSEAALAFTREWRNILRDNKLLAATWPTEYGGAGLTSLESVIMAEEFQKAGVPTGGSNDAFSIQMVGNTIIHWGTEEQKKHFLPRIISGEDIWCQGYSEPNAGSDLGNLGCRATLDGDEWLINGQKIWTSAGHLANWIFVLTRTEPDVAKHRGITFLLCPMDQARRRGPSDQDDQRRVGVQRGVLHRCPDVQGERDRRGQRRLGRGHDPAGLRARRSGGHDAGGVSGRTRPADRPGPGAGPNRRSGHPAAAGVVSLQGRDHALPRHAHPHQVPVRGAPRPRRLDLQALLVGVPPPGDRARGRHPGGRGAEHRRQVPLGAFATDSPGAPNDSGSWIGTFLNARAGTIYAGTSQVQRNIIGEMVLGLPKEPRADGGPWKDIPK